MIEETFEKDARGNYREVLYEHGDNPVWQARMKIRKGGREVGNGLAHVSGKGWILLKHNF